MSESKALLVLFIITMLKGVAGVFALAWFEYAINGTYWFLSIQGLWVALVVASMLTQQEIVHE